MADARRMIFGNSIVVQEGQVLEETLGTKWARHPSIPIQGSKAMTTEITTAQYDDTWTSMNHPLMGWEDYIDATEDNKFSASNIQKWDEEGGFEMIPNSLLPAGETKLAKYSTSTDVDCKFVYIKNWYSGTNTLGRGSSMTVPPTWRRLWR